MLSDYPMNDTMNIPISAPIFFLFPSVSMKEMFLLFLKLKAIFDEGKRKAKFYVCEESGDVMVEKN